MRYSEFQQLNTEILSISTDSVYSHKMWNETELSKMVDGGIPYPMLSDANGNIGRMYDVYDSAKGITLRSTFIIDPNGVIKGMELLSNSIGRSIGEILRQLQALQHNAATGELVPCDWHQGQKTLSGVLEKAGHIWEEWKPEN